MALELRDRESTAWIFQSSGLRLHLSTTDSSKFFFYFFCFYSSFLWFFFLFYLFIFLFFCWIVRVDRVRGESPNCVNNQEACIYLFIYSLRKSKWKKKEEKKKIMSFLFWRHRGHFLFIFYAIYRDNYYKKNEKKKN